MTEVSPAEAVPRPGSSRIAEWVRRYGPAEVAGLVTAILGSWLVYVLTGNEIAAAYGGSIGENIGFYGVIVTREVRSDLRAFRQNGKPYGMLGWSWTVTHLLLEFGGAEVLDTTIVRPLAMGAGTHYLGRTPGVVLGKLAADLVFYAPVISMYELRRRFRRAERP